MALIKSISGIRGTIGGRSGENLTPDELVRISAAFGQWLRKRSDRPHVIIGRDGRISGRAVSRIIANTLVMAGVNVTDLGLSTTPTVAMSVMHEEADGGIVVSASHNPRHWNALKLLNSGGEFLSSADGEKILQLADGATDYATIDKLGKYRKDHRQIEKHVRAIEALDHVHPSTVGQKGFKVVVDCINSTGALAIPPLLDMMGVEYVLINEEVTGEFAHDPEPLPENLGELMDVVRSQSADLGIAVDPDVDRLALVSEDGGYFGEEYTLVAVADYLLERHKGPVVTNLSSTIALADIARKHGCLWGAAAVGEVNVVALMKEMNAVLGGEGNGGVIYPALHYGRDALVGIALFLSGMAIKNIGASGWRDQLPNYYMSKEKTAINRDAEPDEILARLKEKFRSEKIDTTDGLKIYFDSEWVHMRKSNTEPIIRIYAESDSRQKADSLTKRFKAEVQNLSQGS